MCTTSMQPNNGVQRVASCYHCKMAQGLVTQLCVLLLKGAESCLFAEHAGYKERTIDYIALPVAANFIVVNQCNFTA